MTGAKNDSAREVSEDEAGVDQPVRVPSDDQSSCVSRYTIRAFTVYLLEEGPGQKADDRSQKPVLGWKWPTHLSRWCDDDMVIGASASAQAIGEIGSEAPLTVNTWTPARASGWDIR